MTKLVSRKTEAKQRLVNDNFQPSGVLLLIGLFSPADAHTTAQHTRTMYGGNERQLATAMTDEKQQRIIAASDSIIPNKLFARQRHFAAECGTVVSVCKDLPGSIEPSILNSIQVEKPNGISTGVCIK